MSQFLWCDKNRPACLFCNDKVTKIPFHTALHSEVQCHLLYMPHWVWIQGCRNWVCKGAMALPVFSEGPKEE